MTPASNIYCLWYPTGGFGHWVSACIGMLADGFVENTSDQINFSATGDSHQAKIMAPKYLHDADDYRFEFDPNQRYVVLIDNGINSESKKFQRFFPGASIIKICYDDTSWPVVAATMITKTQGSMHEQLSPDCGSWLEDADWARREKYFLYLRDHHLRHAWRRDPDAHCLMVNDLLDVNTMMHTLDRIGIPLRDATVLWQQWRRANDAYIAPVEMAIKVLQALSNGSMLDISAVKDLWWQAVINYFIYITHGLEVPANDYADWFSDWNELCKFVQK
jgi:hypothetical protein